MHAGERNFYLANAFSKPDFLSASVLRNVHAIAHLRYNFRAVFRNVFRNRIAFERRVDRYGKIIAANFFQRENFIGGNAGILRTFAERGRSEIFRADCRGT